MNTAKQNWMIVLFIGSVWGLLEATLGGLLHLSPLPIAGKIMAPIGFGVLFWGLKNNLKASQLVAVALIAASLKFADFFLFGMPLLHIKIINPAQAIVMQGLCFAGVVKLFKLFDKVPSKMAMASFVLFSASFLLASSYSYIATDYVMGAFDIGVLAAIFHMVLGSALTFVTIFMVNLGFAKTPIFSLNRLSLRTQAISAAFCLVASVVVRGLL